MPSFNPSQLEAISAQNRSILVSAAAGSGKTTVMVEKIRDTLMRNPEASISQFLVITFTRDAARHMKDKLRDLLEEASLAGSEAASRALSEIETASVSTIHSFCTQLLKEYNDNTGASMNPRVLRETEKKRILDECFSDAADLILDRKGGRPLEDRQAVSILMTAFQPDEVRQMTEDLYEVLMGIPDPMSFLQQIVRTLPVERWNQEILNSIDLDVLELEELLRREKKLLSCPEALPGFEAVGRSDAELIESFLAGYEKAETAEERRELLSAASGSFAKAPAPRGLDETQKAWKDAFNDLRNSMKGTRGIFARALKRLDAVTDAKNSRINILIQQELRGLEVLLRETAALYDARKLESGVIDYADMEQTAWRIMSDPDKRDELLARYRYIYVDECQDVSGIQDAIIKSLAGPGHQFFMVGDIKQSIYGFRHAEPELFEQERRSYSDSRSAEERRIFFMDNYRSCKNVVDAVNAVFAEAMDARVTDMDYIPEDHLRCNLDGDFGPVDILLIQKPEDSQGSEEGGEDAEQLRSADRLEAQCEAAGRYILDLVSPSPESGSAARYRYRDIVILLRTARETASAVVSHLKKMHIPALFEGAPDFFGLAEIKAFMSLLTVIDNPRNDDALTGALVNLPFLFTERELADIRLEKPEHVPFYEAFDLCAARNVKPIDRRCRQAADQLAEWRRVCEDMSVPDFVWRLMRETGIYAARGAYPDGRARQANLDALYQRAMDGQKAGNVRLSDFVSDLREARETRQRDSDDHPVPGAGDDFVRVMTMHKSKGLEFPVVILMDLQRSIRRRRGDEKLRMNISSSGGALGLYLPAVRRSRSTSMDSQGKEAFDLRFLRKNISENTRLLYVAMTRAQQKLCLIGSMKEGDEELWQSRIRAARIWKTRSMLDMIMPAVLQRLDLPEIGKTAENSLWSVSRTEGKVIEENEEEADSADERISRILGVPEPMLMFVPETPKPVPLKTSVTTLTRHAPVLSEDDSEETVEDKRIAGDAARTFRLSSEPVCPAFLEEKKPEPVNVGTAAHRFMRLIDLDTMRGVNADIGKAVRAEAERMREAGIISAEEAGILRLEGAVSFFRSALGQRMLKSGDIRREAEFTFQVSPGDPTMIQGIVDCVFLENGAWILIDYKTDYDTAEETFVPRHEAQMNWYRTALERLTRIPVREMWLFALRAGKAYPVRRLEVLEP